MSFRTLLDMNLTWNLPYTIICIGFFGVASAYWPLIPNTIDSRVKLKQGMHMLLDTMMTIGHESENIVTCTVVENAMRHLKKRS